MPAVPAPFQILTQVKVGGKVLPQAVVLASQYTDGQWHLLLVSGGKVYDVGLNEIQEVTV